MSPQTPITLEPADIRSRLCGWLVHRTRGEGDAGVRSLLGMLRCIQLDPLEPLGSNADLVALARLDGVARGDVYRATMPGHAFEHFAKERCLLPAYAFPYYRTHAVETMWWQGGERSKRLAPELVADVLAEVRARGPLTAAELTDRGAVKPLDWNGWQGTGKAGRLALELLWQQCAVVVCGRKGKEKLWDVPERALPDVAGLAPAEPFGSWAVKERIAAAGLLSTATGPHWSMLSRERAALTALAIARGDGIPVRIPGSPRTWLAHPDLLHGPVPDGDDRMRILGPLDPLIWDRKLVELAFGFGYVWEVYKPAEKRQYGWYVVPLLHRDRLVGRMEARMDAARGELVVSKLWRESADFDEGAFDACLQRHAGLLAPGGTARVEPGAVLR